MSYTHTHTHTHTNDRMRHRPRWVLPLIVSVVLLCIGFPFAYTRWDITAAFLSTVETHAHVLYWLCTSNETPLLLLLTLLIIAACLRSLRALKCRSACNQSHPEQPGYCLGPCCLQGPGPPPPPPPPAPPTPPAPPHQKRKSKTKKRKRQKATVANVRTGCIMKRANRTYTTPGPKVNPLCARNILEAKQKKNKILSIERKLSLKECTWQFSAHGGQRKYNKSTTCCSGKDCYRKFRKAAPNDAEWAHLVSNYRKYYHSLNNDKKRQWYDEHAIFKEYKKVAEGQTLKKNHQLYTT